MGLFITIIVSFVVMPRDLSNAPDHLVTSATAIAAHLFKTACEASHYWLAKRWSMKGSVT